MDSDSDSDAHIRGRCSLFILPKDNMVTGYPETRIHDLLMVSLACVKNIMDSL